jgi:broad specificity phosphatase PhoE
MDTHIDFYLIRHGRSVMNESGIGNGQLEDPLSDNGKIQVTRVAQVLASVLFDAIRSSPLTRAKQTAEAIVAVQQKQ